MKVRKMVTDAMLIAMFVALSRVATLDLGNMRISVASLPIVVGALLFGPVDGLMIGAAGAFLSQLLGEYGLTATTVLWILPDAARGLVVGLAANRVKGEIGWKQALLILVPSAVLVTCLNTLAMYVDSRIFGYYTPVYVFGALIWRVLSGCAVMAAFALLLPPVIRAVKKNIL